MDLLNNPQQTETSGVWVLQHSARQTNGQNSYTTYCALHKGLMAKIVSSAAATSLASIQLSVFLRTVSKLASALKMNQANESICYHITQSMQVGYNTSAENRSCTAVMSYSSVSIYRCGWPVRRQRRIATRITSRIDHGSQAAARLRLMIVRLWPGVAYCYT